MESADLFSAWRVTNGPNDDWPLSVCDFRTIRREDIETNDVIHRTHVGESTRLYFHPDQRWHFVGHQAVNEVIVFRNTDTSTDNLPSLYYSFLMVDMGKLTGAQSPSILRSRTPRLAGGHVAKVSRSD